MTQPTYSSIVLNIYDPEFNRRGEIDSYIALEWTEDYYGRGSFVLYCVDSPQYIALLHENWYVVRKDRLTAMVIRKVKYTSVDNMIEVRGFTTNDLLNQRILYKTHSVSNVEQGMRNLVLDSISGNRHIPRLTIAPPLGFEETFETQFTGTNLLEALESLGAESQLGFCTRFDPYEKQHVFTVYRGESRISGQREVRPAIFSTELGNLEEVTIINDLSFYRNVAYVAGGGEGEERVWIVVGDADYSGLDRFELFVDARDLQQKTFEDGEEIEYTDEEYYRLLVSRGIKKLNEHIRSETFVAEIQPEGFGNYFYLGDMVSCKSERYRMEINTRILSFSEKVDGGIYRLSLTMGNPEITVWGAIRAWQS